MLWWKAVILGIVEGATEFVPVSSTGHLILVSAIVDYPEPQRVTFEIFIQFGAILAVVWLYRHHLWYIVANAASNLQARSFLGKLALAFAPAAGIGFLFHRVIEASFFNPTTVAYALIGGGIVLALVDRGRSQRHTLELEQLTWKQAFYVGLAQTFSLVPGVSRAAATIVGGLLSGLSRPVATQFSFYLSIPTLAAASLYSLFKARHSLVMDDAFALTVGFVTAFLAALLVVKGFIRFVQHHSFLPFALYRVVLGAIVLLYLASS
ncbi:MAG: undecaprenyl-diphosphate phosphatase [Candidatus Binatia bacterium]|nr:undecaprenyl-diphosphate phosphatase [Candidatus Binatia bacterium]